MNRFALALLVSVVCLISVNSFTLEQLKDGEAFARDCILKIGISPLTVNRLRKGDFSRDGEKSQVRVLSKGLLTETLIIFNAFLVLY